MRPPKVNRCPSPSLCGHAARAGNKALTRIKIPAACGCNRLDCKKSRDNEPPARSWKPPESQRRHRLQTAPNTSVPFVPPKPKPFDLTVRNVPSVDQPSTGKHSAHGGSDKR